MNKGKAHKFILHTFYVTQELLEMKQIGRTIFLKGHAEARLQDEEV
jgi:hypothetical protein